MLFLYKINNTVIICLGFNFNQKYKTFHEKHKNKKNKVKNFNISKSTNSDI